jgi:putative inorganic carbon (HCO3(-)) transporter
MKRGAAVIPFVMTICLMAGIWAGDWLEVVNWEMWFMATPLFLGLLFCVLYAKKYLIYLISFCVPLSLSRSLPGGISLQIPAELLVGMLALIFLVYAFWRNDLISKKFVTHPVSLWISLDLALGLLAVINSELPFVSLKRWSLKLAFALVFFFMLGNWFSERKDYWKVILIWCAGMAIVVIHTLWQHAQYRFGIPYSPAMPRPFFDDHTIYGANLALFLPVLGLILLKGWKQISFVWRGVWMGAISLFSAGIFFSFSRAVWLSLMVTLIFMGVWQLSLKIPWNLSRRIIALVFVGMLIVIGASQGINWVKQNRAQSVDTSTLEHLTSAANIQTNTSNRERINRWLCAIRLFEERPLLGWGPGTYQHVYGPFQKLEEMTRISTYQGDRGNAHSEYLTYLSESGAMGLLGFLGLIITLFYRSIRAYRRLDAHTQTLILGLLAGLMTFLWHGFFNSFLDQAKIAGVFYLFLSILVWVDSENDFVWLKVHIKKNAEAQRTQRY